MDTPTESSPFIWGARDIAKAIGKTERATFHMLERGVIPARRVGARWVADRAALLGFLSGERAATAA